MSIENFIRESFEGHKLLTTFWATNQTHFLPTPSLHSVPIVVQFHSKGTGTMYLRWMTLEADLKEGLKMKK